MKERVDMSSTRIVGTIRREEKCELGESWEMWCWCLANRARYMTETWEGLRVAGCEIRDCTRAVTRHVGGRVWGVFREAEDLDEDGQIRDCCDTFASLGFPPYRLIVKLLRGTPHASLRQTRS